MMLEPPEPRYASALFEKLSRAKGLDQVKITFSIPEKYSSQISVKDTLTFTTSNSGEPYFATIYAIEPSVDVNTRTLKMRALADNKRENLFQGPLPLCSFRFPR